MTNPSSTPSGAPHAPSGAATRALPQGDGYANAPMPSPTNEALYLARHWIEANPPKAFWGAFALGVFVGVLLRR